MKNYMLFCQGSNKLISNLIINDDNSNIKSIILLKSFLKDNKDLINRFPNINFISRENSDSFLTKELSNIKYKGKIMIEKYLENTNDLLNILLMSQRFSPEPQSVNNSLSNSLLALQWADHILTKYKPNKIFFSISPHDLLGYCLYCVAKHKKIDLVIVKVLTSINDKKGFIINDIYDTKVPKFNLSEINSFKYNHDKSSLASIENDIFNYSLGSKYSFSSNKLLKKRNSFKNLQVSFSSFFYRLLFNLGLRKYRIFDLKKYELTIRESFNLLKEVSEKNILFMPLGFQPEVTSNPMSLPLFTAHSSISLIRSILPANWILLLKDHPKMLTYNHLSYTNYRNYMTGEIITNSENCFLVNNKIKSSEILDVSTAVLTGVGSVGTEALLKGIPVITYGNGPYNSIPNVYKCSTYNSIYNALLEIEKSNPNDFDDSLKFISYLKNLEPSKRAIDFQNEVGEKNWETEYNSNLIDLINS